MSEFDDFIRGIGSDIKTAAAQVSKKTGEAFEISKRRAEKVKIKGKIQNGYQHLGELVYGSMKNGEDVSAEINATVFDLDSYFERVREIYQEISEIKAGTYVHEEEATHWDEDYAEGEDEFEEEEEDPEVEVEIIVSEEVPVEVEMEEAPAEETAPAKESEFDINID